MIEYDGSFPLADEADPLKRPCLDVVPAAGAVEAIVTALTTYHDLIPPTINYEFPDPDCDLQYVPNKHIPKKVNVAISNTFGFGGHNASLLFKKFREH